MWVDQEKVLAAKRAFQRGEPFDPSVVRPVILSRGSVPGHLAFEWIPGCPVS